MSLDREVLRQLVREVVREAVGDLASQSPQKAQAPRPTPAPAAPPAVPDGPVATGPLAADERSRTDTVRIANDRDLDVFVRNLLRLFENPKTRADLRHGRLSFRLAGTERSGPGATTRIERGAVTERQITDIAASGASLVLGPRAVLTPLARERARALGVTIHKERT
ncbi:hypothetical protein [Mycolicibacterium parafortuitum]|uniref:Uncharacterized protein n=1 Tax=Mycolicibacterium parafortuitum TaxID=39692 RepID=A0A375YCF5_MYCPF|nr:hypothetical protein [Mycolicibacterium parafortuitum]ORB30797.1 hypothetical protein BST38_08650 [Mycolicibacterium parafortuitum]SRX78774.1 hypothetical protein MPP7335_00503 [Mycolicibacterium parafortuitum]